MKVWRKLTVIVPLALMMALVMSATAFASNLTQATWNNGVAKNTGTANAAIATSVDIPKSITVTGSGNKVYGPTVTYTYDIAPATVSNITVNDGTNSGPVREGVANGVSLSTAAFTSAEETLTDGSATVTANVTATVVVSAFNGIPGIYRYAITEDSGNASAATTAGVTHTSDTLYLDVYLKNGASGLEVYGFVLLDANVSIDAGDSATLAHKVSAFTKDTYDTKDFSVTKSVTGDAGDKTHQFQFAITVSNGGLNFYSGKTTASTTASTDTGLTTTLADTETFVIHGLKPNATVIVTETNNTIDAYTVSVKKNDVDTPFVAAVAVAANGTKSTEALSVSEYSAITFVNNLNAISPTGVVLRYAPYLAMMGAGVVALPLSRRRKEDLI